MFVMIIRFTITDFMGLDTTIPLSPQWLITKSCDGKPPTCAMVSVIIKYRFR